MKEILTIKEVAQYLQVSEKSVYRYIKNDKLKAVKIGHWRIKKVDLNNFIK